MRTNAEMNTEAWRIHRAEGEPAGYRGPCWGPTAANVEQAKRNLATMDEPAEDHTWRLFPTGHGVVAHSHSATESAQWLRRLANDIESSEVSAVATDGCPLLAFGSMDLSAQDEPHSSNSVYTQRRVWTITIKADDGV